MRGSRFNRFDAVVLILVLVLAFFAYSFKSKSDAPVQSNTEDFRVVFEVEGLTEDVLGHLQLGDALFTQNPAEKGFVTDIEVKSYVNEMGYIESSGPLKAIIHVDLTGSVSNTYVEFNGESLKAGQGYRLRTALFEGPSKVRYIEEYNGQS